MLIGGYKFLKIKFKRALLFVTYFLLFLKGYFCIEEGNSLYKYVVGNFKIKDV
jgi:hypothetical protein